MSLFIYAVEIRHRTVVDDSSFLFMNHSNFFNKNLICRMGLMIFLLKSTRIYHPFDLMSRMFLLASPLIFLIFIQSWNFLLKKNVLTIGR